MKNLNTQQSESNFNSKVIKSIEFNNLDTSKNYLHGKHINYSNLNKQKKYLTRSSYVNSKIQIDKSGKSGKSILFMPVSLYDDRDTQENKFDNGQYTIMLFGSLENGEKATVAIHGIEPFIEVQVPDNKDPTEFGQFLENELINLEFEEYKKTINSDRNDNYFNIKLACEFEITTGKPFKYYQENHNSYIKLSFYKTRVRRYALNYLLAKKYDVYHNDLTCYYRVACRDHNWNFATWNIISNYNYSDDDRYLWGHVFHINIKNYPTSINAISNDLIEQKQHLLKDPILSMCWDIETYKEWDINNTDPPSPENPNAKLFMIGITFQWYHTNDQLLRICLVDKKCDKHNDYLTVICETEECILRAFCKILGWMRPDLVLGFNDTNYDWPWFKERLDQHGLINYMNTYVNMLKPNESFNDSSDKNMNNINYNTIRKFYTRTQSKLSAEDSIEGYRFCFPGFVAIDVRTIFRQLFKNDEKSSLNWYLTRLGLSTKLDMNFKDMFDIYEEILQLENDPDKNKDRLIELAKQMQPVAEYCVIDAQRCHELMLKMYVIIDKRAIASMSYTSFQDAIDRADGMRVRNLIIAEGERTPFNLKFSNISRQVDEKIKYAGAYVFPPIKGMVNGKMNLQERIDAAKSGCSEYNKWLDVDEKDLTIAYNLIEKYGAVADSEMMNEIDLDKLNDQLNNLPNCIREFFNESIKRPITGLDFNSLYPSIIMAFNLSTEYMVGDKQKAREFLKAGHDLFRIEFPYQGKKVRGWSIRHDNKLDKTKPDFKFGIFPYILRQLFDQRKSVKKEMAKWQMIAENLEHIEKTNTNEYTHADFMYNYLNAKQKALKVFMNTFYGVLGQQSSPLFMIQIAGGITLNGGRNIKEAQKFVENMGCKVYYGDSLVANEPLIIRNNGKIIIECIGDLVKNNDWISYPQFKSDDVGLINKQQALYNGEIWSYKGWTQIVKVIRHKTNKKIFRVCDGFGVIDVTEDHSLITSDKCKISPLEFKNSNKLLLHSFPKLLHIDSSNEKLLHIDTKKYSLNFEKIEALKFYIKLLFKFNIIPSVGLVGDSCTLTISDKYHFTKDVQYLGESNEYVYDIETKAGTFHAGIGNLIVSNTDSIYSSCPEKYFIEVDKLYFANKMNKLDYWSRMIDITLQVIPNIRNAVNIFLKNDNGTEFLTMAFEEVLFPMVLLSKKKYVGIAHENQPSWSKQLDIPILRFKFREEIEKKYPEYTPDEINNTIDDEIIKIRKKQFFLRGLDIVKRGIPNIAKELLLDILENAFSVKNTNSLLDLVHDKIQETYRLDWSDDAKLYKFVKTDVFRPKRKNIKVQVFVERMREEHNAIIKPFERFQYVIVHKYPYKYDLKGRKIALKIGDKMDLPEFVKGGQQEIDLNEYMEGGINGQLARLITYHPMFHVCCTPEELADDEYMKTIEGKMFTSAKKYIDKYSEPFSKSYACKGDIYKKVSATSKYIVDKQLSKYCSPTILKMLNYKDEKEMENLINWIQDKAQSAAKMKVKKYGEKYVNACVADMKAFAIKENIQILIPDNLKHIYKSLKSYLARGLRYIYMGRGRNTYVRCSENLYNMKKLELERKLYKNAGIMRTVYEEYADKLEDINSAIKKSLNLDNLYLEPGVKQEEILDMTDKVINYLQNNEDNLSELAEEKIGDVLQFRKELNKFKNIYLEIMANEMYILHIYSIIEYLNKLHGVTSDIQIDFELDEPDNLNIIKQN